jgi:hypothetical protein
MMCFVQYVLCDWVIKGWLCSGWLCKHLWNVGKLQPEHSRLHTLRREKLKFHR